jgi:hypothetical protein
LLDLQVAVHFKVSEYSSTKHWIDVSVHREIINFGIT